MVLCVHNTIVLCSLMLYLLEYRMSVRNGIHKVLGIYSSGCMRNKGTINQSGWMLWRRIDITASLLVECHQ